MSIGRFYKPFFTFSSIQTKSKAQVLRLRFADNSSIVLASYPIIGLFGGGDEIVLY